MTRDQRAAPYEMRGVGGGDVHLMQGEMLVAHTFRSDEDAAADRFPEDVRELAQAPAMRAALRDLANAVIKHRLAHPGGHAFEPVNDQLKRVDAILAAIEKG